MNNKNTNTATNATPTTAEYLSAFLDDEAGAFEKRRLLDDVQTDDSLQHKVACFSLIGEAMRNESATVTVRPNFLAGIHEQLDAEPAYNKIQVKPAANQPNWLRPVTGMALAASLAAVVVISMNVGLNDGTDSNLESIASTDRMAAVSDPVLNDVTAARSDEKKVVMLSSLTTSKVSGSPEQAAPVSVVLAAPDAAWRKRLKGYVNSHTKYASTSAIMPSVRAVSYASNY